MLTPGVANRDVLDAIARSEFATSWQPAAVADLPPTSRTTVNERSPSTQEND